MPPHEVDEGPGTDAKPQAAVGARAAAQPRDSAHHVPTKYPAHTGLRLGLFVLVIALLLGSGFFVVEHRRALDKEALEAEAKAFAATPPTVQVVKVGYAPSNETLKLPGETSAWYESIIYARVNGYVKKWFKDIGDRVTSGEVLASIDTPELDQQLIAAQAKLKVSESEVSVMEANKAFAQSTYKRWWESPKGVVSEQERQEKLAEYQSSVAKFNASESQVRLDQANVEGLMALTQFKEVRAPFDGVITKRNIDIGDLVTAGSTASTTSLYDIAQLDKLRIYVFVPQAASVDMKVGTPAMIAASEYPGRQFHGTIARTATAINPESRTLRVEVDVPNPDMTLTSGMYVEVSFELAHLPLPQVPASALLFRANGSQVAVVDDEGKVNFRNVTIARDQGDMVEIGSGLAANDRVALNLSSEIGQGDTVTPIDVDPPTVPSAASAAGR